MYRTQLTNIEELKSATIEENEAISTRTLKSVMNGFENRLYAVIDNERAHIEPFLH